jgi:hypothetical protein
MCKSNILFWDYIVRVVGVAAVDLFPAILLVAFLVFSLVDLFEAEHVL